MNFPATLKVFFNGKNHYLCERHALQIQGDDVKAELLPDDAKISCEECSADRINN